MDNTVKCCQEQKAKKEPDEKAIKMYKDKFLKLAMQLRDECGEFRQVRIDAIMWGEDIGMEPMTVRHDVEIIF